MKCVCDPSTADKNSVPEFMNNDGMNRNDLLWKQSILFRTFFTASELSVKKLGD